MGLLLSILVSCVGVVELIAFYSHLRRSLRVVHSEDTDLETITWNYRKMLNKEYRQIFAEVNGKDIQPNAKTNFALSTSPRAIFSVEVNKNDSNTCTSFQINKEKCNSLDKSNDFTFSPTQVNDVTQGLYVEINTNNFMPTEVNVSIEKSAKSCNHSSEFETQIAFESSFVAKPIDEITNNNKLTSKDVFINEAEDILVPIENIDYKNIYSESEVKQFESNFVLRTNEEIINNNIPILGTFEKLTHPQNINEKVEDELIQLQSNFTREVNAEVKNCNKSTPAEMLEQETNHIKTPEEKCKLVSTQIECNLIRKSNEEIIGAEQSTTEAQHTYVSLEESNHVLTPVEDIYHQEINYNSASGPICDENVVNEEIYLEEKTTIINEISPSIEKIYLQEESMANFFPRRSLSPFPTYESLAPRSSICSELVENTIINVNEVEEDGDLNEQFVPQPRSCSVSPDMSIMYLRRSSSPLRQSNLRVYLERSYRSLSPCNRLFEEDVPSSEQDSESPKPPSDRTEILDYRSTSNSQVSIDKDYVRNSSSPEQVFVEASDDNATQHLVVIQEIFSDDFKNSLDGVKSKNLNEERKREFKRKRSSRNRASHVSHDYSSSSEDISNLTTKASSLELGEETSSAFSSEFLTSKNIICEKSSSITGHESSNEPKASEMKIPAINTVGHKENVSEAPKPGSSKEEKKPEPFWVN